MAKSTVAVKFTGDVAGLKKATGDAEGTLAGFGKKAGGILKAGMLGAGAIAGAALAKGFADSIANEASVDKAAASLGLSPEESAELGKVAGKLYADAYGESFGQVTDAVASVKSALGDLSDADLEGVTANALDFAKAFDQDVNESIGAAGLLLTNGLVADGKEAFDLLTATMQDVPQAARDEVLAATEEYSTFFADLGLSGQEAFGAIAQAAEKGGRFGVDKLGDALKELGIRATDMSDASVAAYESAGLSAREMSWKLLQGGDTARDAFYEIVTGLRGIEGPIEQSKAAIALFGTPLEDLSTAEIPEFLASLDNMGDALGDVEGAADEMGDTLNDNLGTKIESFKRQGLQKLSDFVGGTVIPAIEDLAEVFNEHIRPALEDLVAQFQEKAVPALKEFWESIKDDVQPTIEQLAKSWEEDLLPALKTTMNFIVESVLPVMAEVVGFILRNILPAIIKWWAEMQSLQAKILPVIEVIGRFIGNLATTIANFVIAAKARWDEFVANARVVRDQIKEAFNGVVDFFTSMPSRIGGAASGMWDGIKSAFVDVVNFIINAWNALDFTIPEVNIPGIGKVGGQTIGLNDITPLSTGGGGGSEFLPGGRIPRMATGGVARNPMLAMIGDAGVGDPEIVSPVSLLRQIVSEESGRNGKTVNVTNNFTVNGNHDPKSIAQHVAWALV